MKPPGFPRDIVRMGGEGVVYLLLKIGRQGTVEDMAVEQVNLTAYASNWKMQRIRLGLAEAAVESARKWTFHTPSTGDLARSEEHTSELQSLMRISYAVFCLKKKKAPKQFNATTSKPSTQIT